jgi:hypothetical protein
MNNLEFVEYRAEVKRWSDCLEAAIKSDQVNQIAEYKTQLKDANAILLAAINYRSASASRGNSIV